MNEVRTVRFPKGVEGLAGDGGAANESTANGVDADASSARRERAIGWLEQSDHLRHLLHLVAEQLPGMWRARARQ